MRGIRDRGEEIHVAVHTAAVLGRAAACSGHASWICHRWLDRLLVFVHERVLPIVAEVVDIQRRHSVVLAVVEIIGHAYAPAWDGRAFAWRLLSRRHADRPNLVPAVQHTKLVKMVVEP